VGVRGGVVREMRGSEGKLTTLLSTNQIFQNYRYKKATFFSQNEIHIGAPGQHQIPVRKTHSNAA
jgi:hypothetical protein